MIDLLKTTILGVIQGLTEWLPISSTGHLELAKNYLLVEAPILFDVILHIGTLIVILFFFRSDIKKIASALLRLDFKTEHGRLIPLIVAGTIPTALIGLLFGSLIEDAFQNTSALATAFILSGIILYSAKTERQKTDDVTLLAALIIGTAQGIAIIPGISRSGITIAVALALGIRREKAFKFSFLLSIPAILGALALTLSTQYGELETTGLDWIEITAGTIAAILVGFLSLKLLWKTLATKKFYLFAFYCWTLGIMLLAYNLGGF